MAAPGRTCISVGTLRIQQLAEQQAGRHAWLVVLPSLTSCLRARPPPPPPPALTHLYHTTPPSRCSGRKRAKGEMNGKSANINNAAKQIYPEGHAIPLTEVLCIFDADQVCKAGQRSPLKVGRRGAEAEARPARSRRWWPGTNQAC